MNRAAILSFSERGGELAGRIAAALPDWLCAAYAPHGNLKPLTAELFASCDALIFVGACGIAVRAVAPNIVSKTSDPAVLVVDEMGRFVISLLSGHIGGANALADRVATSIGATPVITTATDVNRRFSADAWAAMHGLYIDDMAVAKRFSAEILRRDLPICADFPIQGMLPTGLTHGDAGDVGLCISSRQSKPFAETLLLVPQVVHVGIGCKRGTSAETIREAMVTALEKANVHPRAVKALASIDVKKDEPGLNAFAAEAGLPITFYSADALNRVPGEFTASPFVRETVGVDNVCERAACCSAGDGATLILKKTALNGVTVAAARADWSVQFE